MYNPAIANNLLRRNNRSNVDRSNVDSEEFYVEDPAGMKKLHEALDLFNDDNKVEFGKKTSWWKNPPILHPYIVLRVITDRDDYYNYVPFTIYLTSGWVMLDSYVYGDYYSIRQGFKNIYSTGSGARNDFIETDRDKRNLRFSEYFKYNTILRIEVIYYGATNPSEIIKREIIYNTLVKQKFGNKKSNIELDIKYLQKL
jgi:hypothetical protein